jgi:hypothetical protein
MPLFFLYLLSSKHKSTHPYSNAAQKMKSSMMKTFSSHGDPGHLPMVVWCFIPLLKPIGLIISSVIILDVINTGYTIYFTIYRFICET